MSRSGLTSTCPWCYVGKRRFEAALAQFEHRRGCSRDLAELRARSRPPRPERPRRPRRAPGTEVPNDGRAGARGSSGAWSRRPPRGAKGTRLPIRHRAQRARPLTAHRVVHLAEAARSPGRDEGAPAAGLLHGGQSWSPTATRSPRLAVPGGPARARRSRGSSRASATPRQVRDDERVDQSSSGLSAVPTFVAGPRLGASGAHPPEALLELLRQGWANRSPVSVLACDRDKFGVDGC